MIPMTKRIRVVATDGEDTISIGNIKHDNHIIISEIPRSDMEESHHTTYYNNGYLHIRNFNGQLHVLEDEEWKEIDTSEIGLYYGPALDNFKGLVSTPTHEIPTQVSERKVRKFKDDNKKFDHVTYLDTRSSEEGLYYKVILCEPGYPIGEMVYETKQRTGCEDLSCNLYTAVEPWVGVLSWPQEQSKVDITATSHFRPMQKAEAERVSSKTWNGGKRCPYGNSICQGAAGKGELCKLCMNELTGYRK